MKTKIQIMEAVSEIRQINETLTKYQELMDMALNDLAKDSCPFKINDKVKILGYSHYGKQGVITHICKGNPLVEYDFYRSNWSVRGIVLKKDGTKGKFDFKFSEADLKRELEKELKNEANN